MLRFSIRELMLVMLVMAMGAGWLGERMSSGNKDINDAIKFMEMEHTMEIANLNGELKSHGFEIRSVGWHGRHVVKINPQSPVGQSR